MPRDDSIGYVLYITAMAQINLHVTPDFEEALEALMRGRALRSKSEAIRHAVQEAAAPYLAVPPRDFSLLQGLLLRRRAKKGEATGRPIAELEREIDEEMDRALAPRLPARSKRAK